MARQLLNVRFNLMGQIREDKETDSFVSYCPALDIYSAGRTRPEAKAALQSAIDMFFHICYSRDILNRALRGRGFELIPDGQAVDGETITVTEIDAEAVDGTFDDVFDVEVPLHLVAARSRATAGTEGCLQ